MYNTTMVCTYPYYDKKLRKFVKEPFCLADVEDLEDMSDDIYRAELLSAFGKEDINNITHNDIDTLLSEFPKLKELCLDHGMILFSYDLFFLTHDCISKQFLDDASNNQLLTALKKNT
jgi:hypothetical protein